MKGLDEHITGNWGEDSVPPEPPDFTDAELVLIRDAIDRDWRLLADISRPAAQAHNLLRIKITNYLRKIGEDD